MLAEIIRWIRELASRFAPPQPCPVPVRRAPSVEKNNSRNSRGLLAPGYYFSARRTPHAPRRSPPSAFRLPPSGFTLVEMLVVITIMMILVAAAATMMQPGTESRRTREAARMVNVYLSSARNRAMETGRPCGVIFRNFGTPGFAMNADQCEVPVCFAGYADSAMAKVTWPNVNNNVVYAELTEGPATGMIRRGDVMQFNGQGPYYAVADDSENAIDTDTKYLTGAKIKLTFDSGQIVPWTPTETLVPFRIFRAPMKGAATPLQLPASSAVDLYWSGSGGGYFGSDSAFTSTVSDVTILFSPNGSVDRVYTGQGYQSVTEPIFLLIGNRERVDNTPPATPTAENKSSWANWQDLETGLWVTINPHTGVINTEPVGSSNGGMPGDVAAARGLAAQAKGMGGR